MAILIEKFFIKLLLVIVLMMQPVALSYAMANMGHLHQKNPASMSHQMMDMEETILVQHTDSSGTMSDTASVDCCDSAACCSPALASIVEIKCSAPNRIFTLYYPSSWQVVNFPAEIRPPRL